MNMSIKRSVIAAISLCAGIGGNGVAWGADEVATSKNAIGATDFYQVDCGEPNTDHLRISVLDRTPGGENNSSILPQYVNVRISKFDKTQGQEITDSASEISPGEGAELIVPAGKGTYKFFVEAKGPVRGPNSKKKLQQTITAEYSCLNDADQLTKPGIVKTKTKKIINEKSGKFSVVCGKNKKLAVGQQETAKLYVKLTNTTVPVTAADPARIALNAQIVKGSAATNTTDFNGDEVYSEEANLTGGPGIYSVLVDNTAFDSGSSQDYSRDYTLRYSCRDAGGNEITTGPAQLVNSLP
jgi:hypothetical protein